jgi:osmotically-inducible protein OsmY
MNRQRASRYLTLPLVLLAAITGPSVTTAGEPWAPGGTTRQAQAQAQGQSTARDPALTILQALQANPLTAPYRFIVKPAGRQYALAGRVGSRLAHDAAIQTVITLGYPVRDDLTIDTTEAIRAAVQAGPMPIPNAYVYPPPLFGRLDDPFYGFEPPLLTYPPFARSVAAREPIFSGIGGAPPVAPAGAVPPPAAGAPGLEDPNAAAARADAAEAAAPLQGMPPDAIQMTLDQRGVAVLRGRVPTMADRVAIGQEVARVAGISQVINLLEVGGSPAAVPGRDKEVPPPPPTPAFLPVPGPSDPRPVVDPAAEKVPVAVDADPLARRVAEWLGRRPALSGLSQVKVAAREGVITLSGRAPSAYEAMLAFRTAQQTPGVRDVVDKLEYPLPDIDQANPLRARGRPSDVEPYLLAQIRRQVGDLAHVDAVQFRGDTLEVRGTVARADDTPRVEATLRSIPLLRGFRLEPAFVAD